MTPRTPSGETLRRKPDNAPHWGGSSNGADSVPIFTEECEQAVGPLFKKHS
jgi:hypothetical protein